MCKDWSRAVQITSDIQTEYFSLFYLGSLNISDKFTICVFQDHFFVQRILFSIIYRYIKIIYEKAKIGE